MASSYEAELRENLMIQNDIHTNNLAKSLQTQVRVFYIHSRSMEGVCLYPIPCRCQADELGDMWERRLEEKLSEQAFGNQKSLSKALGKIRGIELMVDAVTNAGMQGYMYIDCGDFYSMLFVCLFVCCLFHYRC